LCRAFPSRSVGYGLVIAFNGFDFGVKFCNLFEFLFRLGDPFLSVGNPLANRISLRALYALSDRRLQGGEVLLQVGNLFALFDRRVRFALLLFYRVRIHFRLAICQLSLAKTLKAFILNFSVLVGKVVSELVRNAESVVQHLAGFDARE
jgi:hypothetical protein